MARILGAFVLFAMAGCYNPNLGGPGFYCHPTDNPACPDGQQCVQGRCVGENVVVTTDGGGDGGVGGGPNDLSTGGGFDLSQPHDLSQSSQDLTSSQPDLSGGGCGMSGSPCTSSSQCCSGSICFPGLNVCF